MFELIIKESLKAHPLATQLKAYFSDDGSQVARDELNVVEIIHSLYRQSEPLETIFGNFFAIPQALEGMAREDALKLIDTFIMPLIEELPWLKKTTKPQENSAEAHTEEASTDLESYSIHNLSHDEAWCVQNYMATLLARTTLDIMSVYLNTSEVEVDDERNKQLEYAKRICNYFLTLKGLPLSPLSPSLLTLFNGFSASMTVFKDRETTPPACLTQVSNGLDNLRNYPLIRCCFEIDQLETAVINAHSIDDLKGLLMSFILAEQKPLINIWEYNTELVLAVIDLMYKSKSSGMWLSLLASGLTPEDSEKSREPLFEFLTNAYERSYNEKWVQDSLLAYLLVEKNRIPTSFISRLCNLIVEHDDFKMMLAIAIASSYLPVGLTKKKTHDSIIRTLTTSNSITTCWWGTVLKETILPETVEDKFNELIDWYLDDIAVCDPNKFTELCHLISHLTSRHQQLSSASLNTNGFSSLAQLLRETDRILNRLDHCTKILIGTLAIIEQNELDNALKILQMGSDSEVRVILRLLINSNSITSFFNNILFSDKSNKKVQKNSYENAVTSIYYDQDCLEQMSRAISLPRSKIPSILLDDNLVTASQNANLLLILLVLVSRENQQCLPRQVAWQNLAFSLINQAVVHGKDTALGKALSNLIQAHDVCSFLPKQAQQKFLEILGKHQWLANDRDIEKWLTSLSLEQNPAKKSTKHKKQQEIVTASASSVIPTDSASEPTTSDFELLTEIMAKRAERITVGSPTVSNDELDSAISASENDSNDRDEEVSSQQSKTPVELARLSINELLKSIQQHVIKMAQIINEMQNYSALPLGWPRVINQVKTSLSSLPIKLNSTTTAFNLVTTPTLNYLDQSEPQQQLLEINWNQSLSEACWNLQREMEKFSLTVSSLDFQCEFEQINTIVQSVLQSISHCYFKNPQLHIDPYVLSCLEHISKWFMAKGFRSKITGSYFNDPKNAGDVDVSLTPTDEVSEAYINSELLALIKQADAQITIYNRFTADNIVQYQVMISIAGGPELDVDLNFSMKPSTPQEELENTAKAVLGPCAIGWFVIDDGHAVMQPKTARAIFDNRPVLNLLQRLNDEEFSRLSGYIVKNMIKFKTWRLDHHIRAFYDLYINPKTRYASVPVYSPTLIIKNQLIVSDALRYSFKHFQNRTDANIQYIVDNELLQVVSSLDKESYQLCSNYFNNYFKSNNISFTKEITAPAFLAMFFLGVMIDNVYDTDKELVLAKLRTSFSFCPDVIHRAISILKLLPDTTIELYALAAKYKAQKIPSHGLSPEQHSFLQIVCLWHPIVRLKKYKGLEKPYPFKKDVSDQIHPTEPMETTKISQTGLGFFDKEVTGGEEKIASHQAHKSAKRF